MPDFTLDGGRSTPMLPSFLLCQLQHQKLVTAADQDKATAQAQITNLDCDLEAAKQQIMALEQTLADTETSHAQALQVATDHVAFSHQ